VSKKTKKEKILAEQRRKQRNTDYGLQTTDYGLRTTEGKNISEKLIKNTPNNLNIFSLSSSPSRSQTQSLYIYPVHLIKKDLTKTLLLCILAISLELALFLILEQHLVLPFRIK